MVFTTFCMPFTMLSKESPESVNHFIHSVEKGYPIKNLQQPVSDKINDPSTLTKWGYSEFYTKEISLQEHVISPTINTSYSQMLADTLLRHRISSHPFIYSSEGVNPSVITFSPNSFSVSCNNQRPAELYIIQQYNKNWVASVGDSILQIQKNQIAFMKVSMPAGMVKVQFEYQPHRVIIACFVSLLFLLVSLLYLFYFRATHS